MNELISERALRDDDSVIKAYAAHLAGRAKAENVSHALRNAPLTEAAWVAQFYRRAQREQGITTGPVAVESFPEIAYVFVTAPAASRPGIFEELSGLQIQDGVGIIEAGLVQGDHDVVLKIMGPSKGHIDEFVMNVVQSIQWIESTHTFLVINPPQYFHWARPNVGQASETTWILLRVPVAQSGGVVICAQDVPAIVEAAAVFGEADVIVKIQGDSQARVDDAAAELRTIPYAERTQTSRLITGREQQYMGPPANFQYPSEFMLE